MARAVVDPEELRRFARNLRRFNNELQNQMSALHGQLQSLGSSWQDQENQKFADEFEQAMKALHRFSEATNEQVPFLLRKAQRVDEYLRQR